MLKTTLIRASIAACLLMIPLFARAGSDGATVSITGTVDGFAEWANNAPSILAADWSGHITAVNVPQTVTKTLTLWTNVDVTITPTAGANSGVLTNGTQTLITSYELTGADLAATADVAYKLAGAAGGQFFDPANNLYAITHVPGTGSYTVDLSVKMQSQNNTAPDAGDYTCGIVLTASW